MVESSKTSVTEMAMRLNAQHRWCITGTPIQRRLDDLFGLLRFLRTSPFDTYRWWADIVRDPYEVHSLPLPSVSNIYTSILKLYVALTIDKRVNITMFIFVLRNINHLHM
jgi:hypothetical protein